MNARPIVAGPSSVTTELVVVVVVELEALVVAVVLVELVELLALVVDARVAVLVEIWVETTLEVTVCVWVAVEVTVDVTNSRLGEVYVVVTVPDGVYIVSVLVTPDLLDDTTKNEAAAPTKRATIATLAIAAVLAPLRYLIALMLAQGTISRA